MVSPKHLFKTVKSSIFFFSLSCRTFCEVPDADGRPALQRFGLTTFSPLLEGDVFAIA